MSHAQILKHLLWVMYELRVTHRSWHIFDDSSLRFTWLRLGGLTYLRWVLYIITRRWFDESCRSHFEYLLRVMYESRVTSEDVLDLTRHSYMTGRWLVDTQESRVTSEDVSKWDLHDSSNHLRVMNHVRVMYESRVTLHESWVTSRRCDRMRPVDLTESSISHWVIYESCTSDESHVRIIYLTNSIRSTWLGSWLAVIYQSRASTSDCGADVCMRDEYLRVIYESCMSDESHAVTCSRSRRMLYESRRSKRVMYISLSHS